MTTPEGLDPVIRPDASALERIQTADDTLAQRVESLRKTIAELSPEVTRIQTEQKTVWAWVKSGAGFVLFDVIITIAGIFFGIHLHNVQNTNNDLIATVQHNQARLDASIHETCNLYGLFMSFYSDAAKVRFAGGPIAYDHGYIQLQSSSDRLQCGIKHVVPGT
jgi:hypothetical protein